MANRAVFLDRDGTVAEDVGYCSSPEDFRLFVTTVPAIKLLRQHGFRVIIVTNQSGIGRGYFTEEILAEIHRQMQAELSRGGASVDAIYYCPHHPDDSCQCRKPRPQLVLRAARDHDIDLGCSFVVGDQPGDIELGKAVGCRTLLIEDLPSTSDKKVNPDTTVADLLAAAQWILG